jgi:hypothetical protein
VRATEITPLRSLRDFIRYSGEPVTDSFNTTILPEFNLRTATIFSLLELVLGFVVFLITAYEVVVLLKNKKITTKSVTMRFIVDLLVQLGII